MRLAFILGGFLVGLFTLQIICTEPAFADAITRQGFTQKVGNLQKNFIGTILPLISVFGLVAAGILAATGNETAKGKIVVILLGSAIGFLAPYIIGWIQGILN